MTMKRRAFTLAALSCATPSLWAIQSNSVYQLKAQLTDQSGLMHDLDFLRGQPVLVAMFYTNCQTMCPMIIDAIRANEAALSSAEQARMRVLMISFDDQRDTVAALKATATERNLTSPHWTLARSDPKTVRRIAAALGVQYRRTDDGDYNHSSIISLLDPEGRIAARTFRMTGPDPKLTQTAHALLSE